MASRSSSSSISPPHTAHTRLRAGSSVRHSASSSEADSLKQVIHRRRRGGERREKESSAFLRASPRLRRRLALFILEGESFRLRATYTFRELSRLDLKLSRDPCVHKCRQVSARVVTGCRHHETRHQVACALKETRPCLRFIALSSEIVESGGCGIRHGISVATLTCQEEIQNVLLELLINF